MRLGLYRAGIIPTLCAAALWAGMVCAAENATNPAASPVPVSPTPSAPSAKPGEPFGAIQPGIPDGPGVEPDVQAVEMQFVRPLTSFEAGRNDANPVWSPDGKLISFERGSGDKKEIIITKANGTEIKRIYFQLSEEKGETPLFLPGVVEEVSYNAGLSWAPDGVNYAFMSNGGEGNYDFYLGELGYKDVFRLTDHKEKDGQVHWSPVADELVLVSGRTGKGGDIYLFHFADRAMVKISRGGKSNLFPQWSPEGKKIVFMHGSNENHDIHMIADPTNARMTTKVLVRWEHDDLRPVWSPDGKKIAFYTNYNAAGDPRTWSIVVIAADGSDPAEGEGLAAKVVAFDVVPDVERGPAWLPDSSRLVYVKNDKREYNPLYLVNLKDQTNRPLKTETKMNHDVSCSSEGVLAFRAQVNQWDQIFLAKLKP